MARPNPLTAWETLLGEPVAAMAKGRADTGSPGSGGSFKKGTAFLTPTRFIYMSSAGPFFRRSPKNRNADSPTLQFPRNNITEMIENPGRQGRKILTIRYFDEEKHTAEEHKIRLRLEADSSSLIQLLEQDLTGV